MAKFSSTLIEEASGKLGNNLVMRKTAKGQILAKAPKKASQPRRSEKQANTRLQMANLLANYRLYSGKLLEAFESKTAGVSDANMYVSVNWGYQPVYMTRQMRIQGCCVLAEYMICTGSMAPIGYELVDGKLVSDLSLGALVIGEETTVGELTSAVLQNNDLWEEGDQLTCFIGNQLLGSDGQPRCTMKAEKVILNLDDDTKLWDITGADGFSTKDGYLAGGVVLQNMGMAWVHSRNNGSQTKVSTQRLVVVSDVIAQYQTYAAMRAAADSYGGINSKAVYLNPSSTLADVAQQVGGNGGSQQSGSGGGSQNGGTNTGGGTGSITGGGSDNGSGNTGGNTGGGTTGGETTTVAAPQFSGETQFTESTQVTMSAEAGATIHYTTDGTTPTAESSVYSGPLTLTETTTVKAIAVKDGVTSSVTSRVYTKSAGNGGGGGEGSGDME